MYDIKPLSKNNNEKIFSLFLYIHDISEYIHDISESCF